MHRSGNEVSFRSAVAIVLAFVLVNLEGARAMELHRITARTVQPRAGLRAVSLARAGRVRPRRSW